MDAVVEADASTDVADSKSSTVGSPAVRVGIQGGSGSDAVHVRIEHREGKGVDDTSDEWILDKEYDLKHAASLT